MPPASLSTLAVMMPGPTTEATSATRAQPERSGRTPPEGVARPSALDSAMQHLLQNVVHGDDAQELSALVLHRQREEVVLRRLLRHLARRIVGPQRRRVLVHQAQDAALRLRNDDVAQRPHACELPFGPQHEGVGPGGAVPGLAAAPPPGR